jgi:CheY-like chemotaxis protein
MNQTSPRTILVAEDDPIIGMLLVDMLESMGHAVCALINTPSDAVAAAAKYDPDLLLFDIRLANFSGIDAVRQICSTSPIAHIYMSGDLFPPGLPDDVVLHKPFVEADLARAIARAPPIITLRKEVLF